MAAIPINDNTPRNQYTATAAQTTFAYTFWVYAETDLLVYVNGVLKTLTTDYTVSAVQNDSGANVVFNSGLALNDVVTISRSTAQTRITGYTDSGNFSAETLNFELGRYLAMIQDQDKKLDRSFLLPDTSTSSPSLDIPDPAASKLLGWNSSADALENKETTVLGATVLPSVTGKDNWLAIVDESGGTLQWLETLPTAYLDDDAVTLAKMASGTANKYLGYDGSGNPAELDVASPLPVPVYATASTLIVEGSTVNIANTGALGLDTGSEASGTWYYLYECVGGSGTTYVLSATNEADTGTITAPSGYDVSKRQFPIAIRNDGSSNFIEWQVSSGWPYKPKITLIGDRTYESSGWQNGDFNVLSNGTATTATDVDLSSFVPPIAERAVLNVLAYGNTSTGHIQLLEKSGNDSLRIMSGSSGAVLTSNEVEMKTDSSQTIQYDNTNMIGTGIDVVGFIVTEI